MSKSLEIRLYNMSVQDRKLFHEAGAENAWFVPDAGLLPSFAQGFTTCEKDKKTPIMSFYAFPYRKQFWLNSIPVLRVARPMLISKKWDSFTVNILVESLRTLTRRFGIFLAEMEIYSEIKAPIFFPSSTIAVDNCNDPLLNKILITKGLQLLKVDRTFQVKLSLNLNHFEIPSNLKIRPIRSNNWHDRQTYYRLWSESGLLPVSLSKGVKQKASWLSLRPWYGDVCSLLDFEENILIAEMKGIPLGFVHWWPNLYKILTHFGRNGLCLFEDKGKEVIKETGEGKIFKLAVSRKAGKHTGFIKKALLLHAIKIMFFEFGINLCQVSSITPKEHELENLLKELKAEVVHEISLFAFRT